MRFEWDDEKSEMNRLKHGIRFEEAQTVFLDPKAIEFFDINHSDDEDRFIRIGISKRMNLLIVAFCERGTESIRIISARKATPDERQEYEKGV